MFSSGAWGRSPQQDPLRHGVYDHKDPQGGTTTEFDRSMGEVDETALHKILSPGSVCVQPMDVKGMSMVSAIPLTLTPEP